MKTQIAILRGVNVSGQKKIIMTELIELLESLGFTSVQTYIQSGNVIFQSNGKELAATITKAIFDRFAFEVPTQVLSSESMQIIAELNPFSNNLEIDKKSLYYTFLEEEPKKILVEALQKLDFPSEQFVIEGKVVFLHCPNGYGRAKLNNNFLERKLKVSATTRNHKTVTKLVELSQ